MPGVVEEKRMFSYLCGVTDRQKLDGEIPMTYDDFERLSYILDILKFRTYAGEFWNTFQAQFETELFGSERECFDIGEEAKRYTRWLEEFCDHVPEPLLKHLLEDVFELDI